MKPQNLSSRSTPRALLAAVTVLGLSGCDANRVAGLGSSDLVHPVEFVGVEVDSGQAGLERTIAKFRAVAKDPIQSRTFTTSFKPDATATEMVDYLVQLRDALYPSADTEVGQTAYLMQGTPGGTSNIYSNYPPPGWRQVIYSSYSTCNGYYSGDRISVEMTIRQYAGNTTTYSGTHSSSSVGTYLTADYFTSMSGSPQSASLSSKHGCRNSWISTDYYYSSAYRSAI